MAKQTHNHMVGKDFEEKAGEFISLTLDHCEEELRQSRLRSLPSDRPRSQALAAAALSVQQSIKAFLAVARIENE